MHPTVWSTELDTLLMRYGVKFTSYRIKSVSNSLDQTVYLLVRHVLFIAKDILYTAVRILH